MAGSTPGFNAKAVRDGLHFAMKLGAPNQASDKAKFRFRGVKTYYRDGDPIDPSTVRLDHEGNPFDMTVTMEVTEPAPITLEHVAIEFQPARPEELPVGNFKPTKLVVTLLDEEWDKVKDAVLVEMSDDEYVIGYEEPVIGLFGMDVHIWHCFARQET